MDQSNFDRSVAPRGQQFREQEDGPRGQACGACCLDQANEQEVSELKNFLTRAAGQGVHAASPKSPFETPRKYGLLIADDQEDVRTVLYGWMRLEGFHVWMATNGLDAFELYRRHHNTIDVVLLDVRMPGRDGPQTLSALQMLNPHIRCCFMSGDLGSYTEESLRNMGATAVIPKPFCLPEVAEALLELAGKAD